jgi:hypothetical protein
MNCQVVVCVYTYSYVRKATFVLKVQLLIFFMIFLALFTVIETDMNTLNSHNFNKPQARNVSQLYIVSQLCSRDRHTSSISVPFRCVIWHIFEFKPTTTIGQHALYIFQPSLTSNISIYHIPNTVIRWPQTSTVTFQGLSNCHVIQMWSELTWFMWSDFVLNLSEVNYDEVLGDKSTMYVH